MSGDSKIEWTDKTWNPVAGCDRVSPGCDHCYAETIATRFAGSKAFPNGFAVTLHPDRLTDPLKWRKPAKVFVNSMSDLFHDEIEDQFIEAVIQTMTITPQHSYQVLTKRPQRMAKVLQRLSWDCNGDAHIGQFTADELGLGDNEYYDVGAHLPNVWWGTSIESDRYAFRANHLRNTPAAVRFLSLEPLLGPLPSLDLTDIDWVIVGGESGHGARPMDVAWVRELRDRCVDASVPFFFKQWGEWCPDFAIDPTTGMGVQCSESMTRLGKKNSGRDLDGRTWDEYPVTESADIKTKPARGATPEEDEALGYAETGVITEVTPYKDGTGWSVSWGGWGCGCRNVGVEPRVGDTFTTYGRFGSSFYGQALNGKILWYDSIEQQAANNAAASAEYEAERRREFATNLVKMNADFEALPPAFKVRILRNRANDPDYRWQAMGESYEVFTCQQAVILADWARDATSTPEEACDKIDQWNSINSKDHKPKYDYNAQMKAAPKGWSDGHSGNTHGFAVMLAKAWIMGKDL